MDLKMQLNFGMVYNVPGNFHKLKGDDCDCQVPCDMISFQPVLSYAVFPSNDHIKRAAELNLGGAGHLSPEMIKVVHDYMRYLNTVRLYCFKCCRDCNFGIGLRRAL